MQGVISKVFDRQTQWGKMYSFQINGSDKFFGTGKTPPPPAGVTITFDEGTNTKGYPEAKNIQIQQDQPVQSGIKLPVGEDNETLKERYWRIKDERDVARQETIELQSCRNSAIELVRLLITPSSQGEVGLKLPAQAKREEFLVALVNKYTQEFLAANHSENNNDDVPDAPDGTATDGEWNV